MRGLATGIIAALLIASGAHAQLGGDSYNFIKAVKDRDVLKAREIADHPGSTIVNTRDGESGLTGLGLVTKDRDLGWMGFLIQEGADVNARDRSGGTPILVAADQRFLEGAKLLISVNAEIDATNRGGETALIKAVQNHDTSMVRLLVENGANPDKTDNVAGLSARDYAKQDRHSTMVARILDETKPAAVKSANSFSITPKPVSPAATGAAAAPPGPRP